MLAGLSSVVVGAVGIIWAVIMVAVYVVGRIGRRNSDARNQLRAMRKAKEIRDDVESASDQRLVDILTGRVRR